ncbi:MAG: Peptidase E [Phycisphaerae bacterium]|nr:Peptidase E [Phycisphaerae bacterium]
MSRTSARLVLMGGGDPEEIALGLAVLRARLAVDAQVWFWPQASYPDFYSSYEQFIQQAWSLAGGAAAQLQMITDIRSAVLGQQAPPAAVYLGGGNTFLLMDGLRRNQADCWLRDFNAGGGWLAGNSAGAIILADDLRHAADRNVVGVTDFSGLGLLLHWRVWCHYRPEDHDHDLHTLLAHADDQTTIMALADEAVALIQDGQLLSAGRQPILCINHTESCSLAVGQTMRY